ncbi:MAG: hypothetical protein ABW061_03480 [Polyangiaceae bacterium]
MTGFFEGYRALLVIGSAYAALIGCKAHASDAAPASSTAAPALPAVASAVAPVAKAKPWFSGGFAGQYEAKQLPVDVKVGAIREWSKDDGKLSSGPGKLTLQIADDGVVDGSTEGALGASHLSGKVEEDTLRAQLSPDDETGLRGVLVASRDGDGFKGSIEASTGDSLRVRQATVELKKQAN